MELSYLPGIETSYCTLARLREKARVRVICWNRIGPHLNPLPKGDDKEAKRQCA
jgi:hypothetical protein